jgi:hypothetical protein
MAIPKHSPFIKWTIPRLSLDNVDKLTIGEFNKIKNSSYHDKFNELHTMVNKMKNELDKYEKDPRSVYLRSKADYFKGLKDPAYLGNKIERYSNAWLKMFEMLNYFGKEIIDKIPDKSLINTIHIAELPGSMICATRHWIWQNYVRLNNKIRHEWYGESWVDINTTALKDDYGLIARYPEKWFIGLEVGLNGDLSDPRQIMHVEKKSKELNPLSIIASGDLGIDASIDYDEEERLNLSAQFGQDITCLLSLQPGGLMITKHYMVTTDFMVSWVALLTAFFTEFHLCKPSTSRSRNSEIYFIGVNFLGISENMRKILLEKVTYLKTINIKNKDYTNSLLTDEQIGSKTIMAIFKASQSRARNQQIYLSFISRYTAAGLKGDKSMESLIYKTKRDAIDYWMSNNQIIPIPDNMKVIK